MNHQNKDVEFFFKFINEKAQIKDFDVILTNKSGIRLLFNPIKKITMPVLLPVIAKQNEFNSYVVQILNHMKEVGAFENKLNQSALQPFTQQDELTKNKNIFAKPREVSSLQDCWFYHTMEIPGYGLVEGEWDLRAGVRNYLGNIELKNKRVLEVGTASGYLCFYMESQGAEVIAYDLSPDFNIDVLPFAQYNYAKDTPAHKYNIGRLNNSFWLCHKAFNSKANMVFGTAYSIPEEIGMVDISIFGCILLHLRDPFLALQNALRLTRRTVIIIEPDLSQSFPMATECKLPAMYFMPNFKIVEPKYTWWSFSPEILINMLGLFGFEQTELSYHFQNFKGRSLKLFTIVAHRTKQI